jgi:hypothetical protein
MPPLCNKRFAYKLIAVDEQIDLLPPDAIDLEVTFDEHGSVNSHFRNLDRIFRHDSLGHEVGVQ